MAGQLRITGGKLLRRHFHVPQAADQGLVRPTGDRVRGAVFSALFGRLDGALVLDLFAGSGAYGFESLSRGAKSVLFVEKDRKTAACIRENAEGLGVLKDCSIVISDVLSFIQRPGSKKYGLLFVDPPYPLKIESPFWDFLKNWMSEDALVIFRCKDEKSFEPHLGYEVIREKSYGGTCVFFLKKSE